MGDEKLNGEDVLAEPAPLALTRDEARISVAKAVVKSLQRTIATEHQRLSAVPPLSTGEAENTRLMIQAAAELVLTLEAQVARFSIPRILRPTRSTRTFRG